MAYAAPKKKSNIEFKIGAGLFSILGILFILAAFVMLGMTYMNGFVKGMCLYLISIIFIIVSEVFIKKRMEKFSLGITGLGICSLYASTILNYLYLHNFDSIVAMIVAVVITGISILISRRKDAGIIQIISFIGCYICFFPINGFSEDLELLTVTGILFAVNVMTACISNKAMQKSVHITHMIANTIFNIAIVIMASISEIDGRCIVWYVLSNILILNVIFVRMQRMVNKIKEAGGICRNVSNVAIFASMLAVDSFIYVLVISNHLIERSFSAVNFGVWCHVATGAYVIIAVLSFLLLIRSKLKWIQYYAINITIFLVYGFLGSMLEATIAILGLFVLSKILSRVKALRVSEIVITAITALIGMWAYVVGDWYAPAVVIAFLLSILALNYFRVGYQIVITIMVCLFTLTFKLDLPLLPAINVGVLYVLLLLFNNVKFFRGRNIRVYNYVNLAFMIAWCIVAIGTNDLINNGILAILGTSVILLTFQDKYYMNFRHKYLMLAMFLTYITLICRFNFPVVASGILMIISIGCVVTGFSIKNKHIRIYGLVLSLLVCAKIMLYDFLGIATVERMLLFFVVGVMILVISCIYIILEKKMVNRGNINA